MIAAAVQHLRRIIAAPLRLFGGRPVASRTAPTDLDAAAASPAAESVQPGPAALVADDDSTSRQVARVLLESLGYRVDAVENGAQAVTACRDRRFALALIDCHMPVLDGVAAAREIRAIEQAQGAMRSMLLAISADERAAESGRCGEADFDGFLTKPLNARTLRRLLGRPDTADAPADHATATGLDPAILGRLQRMGQARGHDLVGDIATRFLDAQPHLTRDLQDALARADLPAVAAAAHALRSISGNIGATTLSRLCGTIEESARAGQHSGLDEAATDLARAIETTILAVQRLRPSTVRTAPAQPADADGERQRILIVDDDDAFRLATRLALESANFVAAEAADGTQALEVIGSFRPHLVLLDAVMRGMDGFTSCKKLRAHPAGGSVPILMVTGLNDVDSVQSAFVAGATGFASKPVSYPVLIQRIRFTLRASETESALREHKAMLVAAQRAARLGYWRWDHASGEFELSENLCELCGIAGECKSPLDIEGFLELVHAQDREHVHQQLLAAMNDEQIGPFDFRTNSGRVQPTMLRQTIERLAGGSGRVLLGTIQDVTEQRRSEENVRRMAYYDALTGLASRSHLMQHIEERIKVAQRRDQRFSLLLIDLDGFKDVNDSLGHDVGDTMLVRVARRLAHMVDHVDFVARLGGDEFCILLDDGVEEIDAAEVAASCLDAVHEPLELGGRRWRPQASIGVARFPEDGTTTGLLLKAADSAMYAAKQAGKHRYEFYCPEMTEETERRLAHEQMLRTAIEQEQFELYYQPQIDLHSGHVVGVEALARWRHPQRGIVMPNEFIHTLERIGLIRQLGSWVIRTACRQAMNWADAGLPEIRIAVNVSPLHLLDPEMVDSVREALDEVGLPPNLLELEITESSVQSDRGVTEALARLQALGVRISIDDFGTGYSSLGSLKHLPINTLKIDRVFVADMLNNDEDAIMLGTIIGLAHALSYTVVAEGVEEREQAQILAGLRCDLSQGYFFSRPVSADAVPALVGRGSLFHTEQTLPPESPGKRHGAADV